MRDLRTAMVFALALCVGGVMYGGGTNAADDPSSKVKAAAKPKDDIKRPRVSGPLKPKPGETVTINPQPLPPRQR
jgi:hypothetical protein